MPSAQPTFYCARCLSTFRVDDPSCPNLGCSRPRPSGGWGRMYEAGDVLDRTYRIHKQLALGGAGVTYLARELGADGEETGPRVAAKVLFATRDEGPYLRRLATEAQILQELDHPNIVQYLGFVHRTGHSPYLLTHFEEGGSLLDHLSRVGIVQVRQAAQIGRQICWALEKADEAGIVHRDLKPENILLARLVDNDEPPVVRVADFGIAKVQSGLGSGLTRVGAFVGTPNYAPPELFAGREPSPATDVYGVGAILYFCVTAQTVVRFADRLAPEDSYQLLVNTLPPVATDAASGGDEDPEDLRRFNKVLAAAMAVEPTDRCTIAELEVMLGALAVGREPELPIRAPAMAPKATLRAEPTLDQTSYDEPPTPPPAGRPASPPPPARKEGGGGAGAAAMLGGAGLLGLLLLAAGVAGAWWTWGRPATDEDPEHLPSELTGLETDPKMVADWTRIGVSLDAIAPVIAAKCQVPAGTEREAVLVVEGGGQVRAVALSGADDSFGPCVSQVLGLAKLGREAEHPVRLRRTLKF